MLNCTHSSPQAFTASNRASSVGRPNVPSRMPICIRGAGGLSGSAAAGKVRASRPDRQGAGRLEPMPASPEIIAFRDCMEHGSPWVTD